MILPVPKSAAENYLIWIEKEKTSDINLEFIWLGIGSEMKFICATVLFISPANRSDFAFAAEKKFEESERFAVDLNKTVFTVKTENFDDPFQE